MHTMLADIRYALRQLRRAPGFTLTVMLTLVLAVGATAAMTGVLRATLLNPLPYPHSNQLVEINDQNVRGFTSNGLMSIARTAGLADLEHNGHKVFSSFSFYYYNDGQLALQGHQAIRASAAAVSGNFFNTVAMAPLVGRALTPADDIRNAPLVAVLSHRLWMSVFSGDRSVLGRDIRLGNDQATIVGVMPEAFALPASVDLWYPGHVSPTSFGAYRGDGSRFVVAVGRLNAAESVKSATQQASLLATQLARAFPETDAPWIFRLTSLRSSLFGDYRQALRLLSAAVGLVLLVAAVNIASLQLSRNASRESEFAIRSALGVSRSRLARQLLTESVLLVLGGSLAGIAAGALLLQGLATQLPSALLRVEKPHVDLPTVVIACTMALLIGLFTGIVPALQSTRASLRKPAGHSLASGTRLFGRTFTVAQIALALVLLTLSATVLQGLYGLLHTPLGFETAQVETCTIDLPWGTEMQKRHELYAQLESSLAAMPGVSGAGAITALPLTQFSLRRTFDLAGRSPTPQHDAVVAEGRLISPGYLGAMGIPLLAGRSFTPQDIEAGHPSVVLVNHTLAARYFAGHSAVGQRLLGGKGVSGNEGSSEIVGVIGDVRGSSGSLATPPQPEVYDPENGGWPHMQFAIRTALPASVLEPQIRRVVGALDASTSVGPVTALAGTIKRSLAQPRLNAGLLTSFAALSLLLVVVGVYGLVAFNVAQRTRELGLRLALGSTRAGVLRLLLVESARILSAGLVLGVAGSWLAARVFAAGFGAEGHFAALATLTAALLSIAVLCATLIPAHRASSIDPMQALRSE